MFFFYLDPPNLLTGLFNVTKNATDTLKLFCNFTGTPTPAINWIKISPFTNEETLVQSSSRRTVEYETDSTGRYSQSTLTIADLVKDDEGTYRCIGINYVDNLIGAVNSSEAFITIQGE